MSNTQSVPSGESMCEIIGCSSPATTTRWLIDEERHIHVCFEHANDAEDSEAADS